MKKSILRFSSIVSILVLLFACKKDNTDYTSYFYMKTGTSDTRLGLYIDGNFKGDLPVFNISAHELPDSLRSKSLSLLLKSGKYKIEAKDNNGNIKSASTLKFSDTKTSVSGNMGGVEVSKKGNILVIGVFN